MGASDNDVGTRRMMRKAQDLKEAGAGRFGFVNAICEGRGRLNRRLGRRRFTKEAVRERPRR